MDEMMSSPIILYHSEELHKALVQMQRDQAPDVQGFHRYATSLAAV